MGPTENLGLHFVQMRPSVEQGGPIYGNLKQNPQAHLLALDLRNSENKSVPILGNGESWSLLGTYF